jgi:hypothetical protein
MSRRKGRQTDSEFEQLPLSEVQRIYEDPREEPNRRRRALRHLKAKGARNVRKRRKGFRKG